MSIIKLKKWMGICIWKFKKYIFVCIYYILTLRIAYRYTNYPTSLAFFQRCQWCTGILAVQQYLEPLVGKTFVSFHKALSCVKLLLIIIRMVCSCSISWYCFNLGLHLHVSQHQRQHAFYECGHNFTFARIYSICNDS